MRYWHKDKKYLRQRCNKTRHSRHKDVTVKTGQNWDKDMTRPDRTKIKTWQDHTELDKDMTRPHRTKIKTWQD